MIRIAVCDDDAKCLTDTANSLHRIQKEEGVPFIVSTFDNGDALLQKAAQTPFDIVFLDVLMPLLNGIETAHELRSFDKKTKLVFLSSSPEFALQGYDVKASNYLVKPVAYGQLKGVMHELVAELAKEAKSISVKTAGGYRKVYLRDIEYLEANNKKVIFVLSGEMLESTEPLYIWEKLLPPTDGFFKCHRSYLVNILSVDFFDSTQIHTMSGKSVPIARGYGKGFETAYFSLMFNE